MYGICLRYCKRNDLAGDALQAGFVKVFKSIKQFKGEGELGAWIRMIIVRTSLSLIKVEKKHDSVELGEGSSGFIEMEFDIDLDKFDYKRMLEHLERLPQGYRLVFSMNVFDEMPHKDIAKVLKISENTSRSQLLKARKMLQKSIMNDDYLMKNYMK